MPRVEKITSRDNSRLIAARKVRDGRDRKRIFIEGKRLAEEAFRSGVEIDECFVAADFADRELLRTSLERSNAFAELPARIFQTLADTKVPQGIILIAKRPGTGKDLIKIDRTALPVVILLHEINNPSNLGAVLRTAEAAGVSGVIISQNSADVFSPKALRAAMGASLRIPIWDDVKFVTAIEWARKMKLIVAATDTKPRESYTSFDWREPRLLIFGSEAHGLNEDQLSCVDERMSIPMEDPVESLNLAVSVGIILFEAKRQRASDLR